MNPMLLRISGEGNHTLPVGLQFVGGFRIVLLVPENRGVPQPLAFFLTLRIRNPTQRFARLAPYPPRQGIQNISDLVIPAPLLLSLRMGPLPSLTKSPDAHPQSSAVPVSTLAPLDPVKDPGMTPDSPGPHSHGPAEPSCHWLRLR